MKPGEYRKRRKLEPVSSSEKPEDRVKSTIFFPSRKFRDKVKWKADIHGKTINQYVLDLIREKL